MMMMVIVPCFCIRTGKSGCHHDLFCFYRAVLGQ
jgi:hypothetical protein